ncbi:MAG: radical SAM family heme chaperone HemW [Butyrivibrio sp.]|nr:radical SAM family heme chaperone HemW [Butyrivibrio sp.]MBR1641168.1 radical SAM family heme chaperone HemW [Butyrivibrio sp.]
MNRELSIYVHIPFCERKCLYCDFLSFSAGKDEMDRYFDALVKEITMAANVCQDRWVKSIFFGGGTPSFPESELICNTLRLIRSSFNLEKECEISIEVNPASAIYDKLVSFKDAGFNRLSIGAQSLNNDELKKLGRLHDSRMFFETYENARAAGFENINIDVMSALPDQSLDSYMETLKKVVDLGPEHISAYSLIVEEGTPFYDMDLKLPSEEVDRAMYHETKRYLKEHGYHRYEISNYARNSDDDVVGGVNTPTTESSSTRTYECIHNKVYWQRGNYLGFGLGAASMLDNVRWDNTRDMHRYAHLLLSEETKTVTTNGQKGRALLPFEYCIRENLEELSLKSQMEEFMFLGLRLVRGVDVEEFRQLFSQDITDVYGDVIERYVKSGHLEIVSESDPDRYTNQTYLRLTDAGLDVSNTIMADFLL